jgi:hypothetical protein
VTDPARPSPASSTTCASTWSRTTSLRDIVQASPALLPAMVGSCGMSAAY